MDKPLRSLAPHPAGPSQKPEMKVPKRENISLACSGCKSRKSKCDGAQPCQACSKRGKECVFDETTDKRRRLIMKRKMDSLEDDRDMLLQLVSKLRDSSNSQVIQLLHLIRSNAPLDEIKDYMDKNMHDELEKTPELMDIANIMRDGRVQSRRRVLDVRRLSDDPLWDVPAKPWTSLTDDDAFVSHLVSLFFTWFHPYLNFIDRDRFIKDMQSGDPENCLYCSPFLVNAILADACAYSDYPEAFAQPDDLTSKGKHFYEEARMLYENEDGKVRLTTVQGLCILFSSSCLYGKDRRGWLYVGQLVYVTQDLLEEHDLGTESIYAPEVVNLTVWGLYNIMAANSLVFHKRILFRAPKRPYGMHPSPQPSHKDLWTPYPSLVGAIPAHTAHMVKAYSDLSVTIFESSSWFFKRGKNLENMSFLEMRDAADDLYARLKDWKANINDCMKEETNTTPHGLSLHMYWNNIIMSTYGFVQKKAYQEDLSPEKYQSVKEIRLTAAREVGRLMEVHRSLWGSDRIPASNMQPCSMAENTLLEDLDNPASRKAFIDLCIISKAAARLWPIGKAMLRALHVAAKELAVALPSETDALFSDIESNWSPRETKDISSKYPNFAIYLKSKNSNEAELDTFLEKWDALQIDDSGP